jgi:hypothetical protein
MLEHSSEIGTIAAALSGAQAKFAKIVKDTENPFFKMKYAPLSSVIEATRKAMAEAKIAVMQDVDVVESRCVVTTMLIHESGQWMKGTISLPVTKPDAQGVGSASTYGRRYGLSAFLNVAADDDDDGNAASKPVQNQTTAVDATELLKHTDSIAKAKTLDEAKKLFGVAYKWASAAKDVDAMKTLTAVWEGSKRHFNTPQPGIVQSRMEEAKDAVAK